MFEFRCYYDDGFSEPCSFWDAEVWPLADALDRSQLATYVKDQIWIVPTAGAIHLIMLAAIGGLVFLADMRMMGFGLRGYTPAEIEARTRRPLILSVIVMVLSGIVLGLGEVMRLFESVPYHMKMVALFSALLFTFGVRPAVYRGERLGLFRKLLGILAISLSVYAFVMMANARAWYAMGLLVATMIILALVGHGRRVPGESVPFGGVVTAATSTALWLLVAISGRWIAFY